jgi:hypothetical protein
MHVPCRQLVGMNAEVRTFRLETNIPPAGGGHWRAGWK